jgi:RNA-directed DNA polymerase
MHTPLENQPAKVFERTQQAGEIRSRWDWAEPAVWTDAMLSALETGVRGGKWFRLVDKVYALRNLQAAFAKVKANRGAAGVDNRTIEMFEQHLESNLEKLARALKDGSYSPEAVKRVWIPKPGSSELRPLGIPTVRDRVVQAALRSVLEPIFEREFHESSYGFRPKRGCKDALREVNALIKRGYTWVVDADLKSYFDTIPHGKLMELVEERVADGKVLKLVETFLTQGVLEDTGIREPEEGSPQGAVISPLLANIYLNPLDHRMAAEGYEMVRYADDFVVLCRSEEEARAALEQVREWTAQAGLTLHPEKTRIVKIADRDEEGPGGGVDFLGYRFERDKIKPREKSLRKFKDTVREETPRNDGRSLVEIIAALNTRMRGWFEYYKQSGRELFPKLDGWIRMRLRSILRKRHKQHGIGKGASNIRWPNAYFAAHELYSLAKAHEMARRSCRRR